MNKHFYVIFPGYSFNMWSYLPFWISENLSALCTASGIYRSLQTAHLNLLRPNNQAALRDRISEVRPQVSALQERVTSLCGVLIGSIRLNICFYCPVPTVYKKQNKTVFSFGTCVFYRISKYRWHTVWKFNLLDKNNPRGLCFPLKWTTPMPHSGHSLQYG